MASSSEAPQTEIVIPIQTLRRLGKGKTIMKGKGPVVDITIKKMQDPINQVYDREDDTFYTLISPEFTMTTINAIGDESCFLSHIQKHGSYWLSGYDCLTINLKPSSLFCKTFGGKRDSEEITLAEVPQRVIEVFEERGIILMVIFHVPLSKIHEFYIEDY